MTINTSAQGPMTPPSWSTLLSEIGLSNNSNEISKEAFASILEEEMGDKFDTEKFEKHFSDISKDGKTVTQEDYIAMINNRPPIEDANNPPKIEKPTEGLKALSQMNWEDLVTDADTNEDGSLSLDEFKTLVQSKSDTEINTAFFGQFFAHISGEDDSVSQKDFEKFKTEAKKFKRRPH